MAPNVHQNSAPHKITDTSGWSILQNHTVDNLELPVYVHPLVKSSKTTLSDKSLEMCTESLGSETGSDHDASYELPALPEKFRAKEGVESRRWRRRGEVLPPPLPSISGVQVERVREGGRLVMKAVAVGPTHSCFDAQREDGRLRLRFVERCVLGCGGDDVVIEDMAGILAEVEGDNGDNKYERPTMRCNEDGGRNLEMLNLDAFFWVATS